ncbi:MAG: hypothetical protein IPN74_14165 [Haliscomenobacter sp.]|nr:hypothetical protein [Haliscomenobacter sp.]
MKTHSLILHAILAATIFSCKPENPPVVQDWEAMSLDGRKLYPPKESPESLRAKDSLLAIAQANYLADSNNLDNVIWLGRRIAYLSRYREAIEVYTRGMKRFPQSPELYRHRGHRYLSIRKFDQAIADFKQAAALAKGRSVEIEPDGIPNRLNQPLSSLQFNIYYHLALAYYLKGEFEQAVPYYDTCMVYSTNPDLLAATTDWLYMTYRRLGQTEQAQKLLEPIGPDMEIIENDAYYQRLLMYKGLINPESLLDLENTDPATGVSIVTQGYGVANWHLCNGDSAKAKAIFAKILETEQWAAFGYLAAEADQFRH